jgi:hypothetical protein
MGGSADADVPVQDAHKIAAAIKVHSCSRGLPAMQRLS